MWSFKSLQNIFSVCASVSSHLGCCIEADEACAEVYCKPHQVAFCDAGVGFTLKNNTLIVGRISLSKKRHIFISHNSSRYSGSVRVCVFFVLHRCYKWSLCLPVFFPPRKRWPSGRPSPRARDRSPAPHWTQRPRPCPSARWNNAAVCPAARCPEIQGGNKYSSGLRHVTDLTLYSITTVCK